MIIIDPLCGVSYGAAMQLIENGPGGTADGLVRRETKRPVQLRERHPVIPGIQVGVVP